MSENISETNELNGNNNDNEFTKNWSQFGFSCEHLYKIGLKFFRDNENKAFHLSYDERNQLSAFMLQEKHGSFENDKSTPLGTLDIIGRDRRNAWILLANMTREESQIGFIHLLDSLCPLFKPYVEAIKCDFEEKQRIKQELEESERRQLEQLRLEQEKRELELKREEEGIKQKQAIQEALNRQTLPQFKSYAEQQYPGNAEQQQILICQLQEQHYQQYMQQIVEHQLQKSHQPNNSSKFNQNLGMNGLENELNVKTNSECLPHKYSEGGEQLNSISSYENCDQSGSDSDSDDTNVGPIASASMWTRRDMTLFKESIRTEGGDGIIKVGHGEIVTVRVPTHQDGTCIFWEFATDSYDIGFGLLFEWTKNPGNQVSVHISESEDEEEDEDEGEVEVAGDIEKGTTNEIQKDINLSQSGPLEQSPISVIIPIYRRDSHEEVFAGSHAYPGKGVYLLKFDNSYSLWRSKTLYYRVYYTR